MERTTGYVQLHFFFLINLFLFFIYAGGTLNDDLQTRVAVMLLSRKKWSILLGAPTATILTRLGH